MDNLCADLVVVSDVHLSSSNPERTKLFLKALESIASSNVRHLALLGDIFDFCLGNHRYFKKLNSDVGEALTKVANSGTTVTYLEGNHEFRLPDFQWSGVQVHSDGQTSIEVAETTFKLAHGDMVYSHERYKKFRCVVKSRPFTELARWIPGPILNWLATRGAHASRSQDQYRTIHHDKILNAAETWLNESNEQYGLFGHFHVPYAQRIQSKRDGGLFSVDCWDSPNLLIFRDRQFYRTYYEGGSWSEITPAKELKL